jgi:hypothetical protein
MKIIPLLIFLCVLSSGGQLLHLNRIKLRHGGVTVLTMSIEIEERRFGVTPDGAPYPPIPSVDDNLNLLRELQQGWVVSQFENPDIAA